MLRRRQQRMKRVRRQMNEEEEVLTVILTSQLLEERKVHRGSVIGRQIVPRDRYSGYIRLMNDYFVEKPVYGESTFRRRFRMKPEMFNDILQKLGQADKYFRLEYNAAGVAGFYPVQKMTAAVRMLAYGGPADQLDEIIRIGESTVIECVKKFTRLIVQLYGEEYLREPNQEDIDRLLSVAKERGFPGMLGSIDCMHWEWDKCPVSLHGQYKGHFKRPSIILEAVASYDLWIWHAFFGMPGSCNDINVLNRSPVFDSISSGIGPTVEFKVNGKDYDMGYYLADGIYPAWATLISGISKPGNIKETKFTEMQAALRKEIERSFGVMQAKYAIIKGAARMWCPEDLKYIVLCVIILHNMGIKYEHGPGLPIEDYDSAPTPSHLTRQSPEIKTLIAQHKRIRSRPANQRLKQDLVEHVWSHYGANT